MDIKNIPLRDDKFVPLASTAQSLVPRSYNSSDQIIDIAIHEYNEHKKGLVFTNLLEKGLAKSKRQAQMILKYHRRKGTLCTLFNSRPQMYYPTCLKSEIHKDILKNTQVDPIGVGPPATTTTPSLSTPSGGIRSKHPLSECFEYMAKLYIGRLCPSVTS